MNTGPDEDLAASESAVRKAFRRLVPLLVLIYIIAYIDRINIGFAALSMNEDLGLTAAMFGLANTAFYIAYSLFEVPSIVMMGRLGARIWIPRIMITWGLASAATMFVVGPNSLYLVRALIGLAEAGFLPGMLFYLSSWFPAAHRAKANAIFLAALPIAIMIGSPLSGLILQLDGYLGLDGWRWLFLLEGLPAVLLGVAAFFIMPERPREAKWLTPVEKESLEGLLEFEQRPAQHKQTEKTPSIWRAIRSKEVLWLGLVYFCIVATVNTLGIWSPLIIKELLDNTESVMLIGFVGAIPPLFAIIGMQIFSAHSDRIGERFLYCAFLMSLAAFGWMTTVFGAVPLVKLLGLCLCYIGAFSTMATFWAAANTLLLQASRAVSIAAISTLGTFASILSPSIVGVLHDLTGTMTAGVWYSTTLLAIGVGTLIAVARSRHRAVEN